MDWLADDSPIIACATGTTENSGLGVLRLSGFDSLDLLKDFFSFNVSKIKPRYGHLTRLLDPLESTTLDECLIFYFPSPHSFTGENVLEIHCHGNQFLIQTVIDLFCFQSVFRPANPGEFSFRALRNKKINLAQVEGLDLVLNSSNKAGISEGLKLLNGELNTQFDELYDISLKLRSAVELAIDFSEDVGEDEVFSMIKGHFNRLKVLIFDLHERCQDHSFNLSTPSLTLAGPVNAGKSTFFNSLLNQDRAIVSNIPGTTRDYLTEAVSFFGHQFKIYDTAGLRQSDDFVEAKGIDRANQLFSESFFKILVFNPFEDSFEKFESFFTQNIDLVCFTHFDHFSDSSDLIAFYQLCQKGSVPFIICDFSKGGPIEPLFSRKSGPIEPLFKSGPIGPGELSKFGPIGPEFFIAPIGPKNDNTGPIGPFLPNSDLRHFVLSLALYKYSNLLKGEPLFVERHRIVLRKINELCLSFDSSILDMGIISHHISLISRECEKLIGAISPDDVLNSIFSNFCIGK